MSRYSLIVKSKRKVGLRLLVCILLLPFVVGSIVLLSQTRGLSAEAPHENGSAKTDDVQLQIQGNGLIPAPSGDRGITAILVNWGDDNGAGLQDFNKVPDIEEDETEFEIEEKDLEKISLTVKSDVKLDGFVLKLTVPHSLKAWENRYKKELQARTSSKENSEVYTWTIGQDQYPGEIFVEGLRLPTHDETNLLKLELWTPDQSKLVQRDQLEYRIVAPYWNGFSIPERWQTSQPLSGIFVSEDLSNPVYYGKVCGGFTRTPFPDTTKEFASTQDRKAASAQILARPGFCAKSLNKYLGDFDITTHFDFVDDIYVHAVHPKDTSPSFFRNSGIYIYGVYEIQIFDTETMLGTIGDYQVERIGNTFKLVNGDSEEDENGCVTGIPYKRPQNMQPVLAPPDLTSRYDFSENGVRKWIKPSGNVMTVSVRRLPAPALNISKANIELPRIRVKVVINGVTSWIGNLDKETGTNNGEIEDGRIWLQAHWGSGIKFTHCAISTDNLQPLD